MKIELKNRIVRLYRYYDQIEEPRRMLLFLATVAPIFIGFGFMKTLPWSVAALTVLFGTRIWYMHFGRRNREDRIED